MTTSLADFCTTCQHWWPVGKPHHCRPAVLETPTPPVQLPSPSTPPPGESGHTIILEEKWIRAAEICRRLGVDASTVWRWHKKGLRGPDGQMHKLQVVKRPGYVATTREWVDAFFAAVRTDAT